MSAPQNHRRSWPESGHLKLCWNTLAGWHIRETEGLPDNAEWTGEPIPYVRLERVLGDTAHIAKLEQTVRSQRGMLKVQGEEIVRLRRRVLTTGRVLRTSEKINARLAADLLDAWEFIWKVAGGALPGGNAMTAARQRLLKAKTTEADRAR